MDESNKIKSVCSAISVLWLTKAGKEFECSKLPIAKKICNRRKIAAGHQFVHENKNTSTILHDPQFCDLTMLEVIFHLRSSEEECEKPQWKASVKYVKTDIPNSKSLFTDFFHSIRGDEPINYRWPLCQISQGTRATQLFSHTKLDLKLLVAHI